MKKNRILMLCIVCLTILNLCVFAQVAFTLFRLPSTKIDEANSAFSLELVGIAISVWIGLNVYNIISKEEVNEIAESAREALTQANFAQQNLEDNQKAIAVLYKEVFCSKLLFRENCALPIAKRQKPWYKGRAVKNANSR